MEGAREEGIKEMWGRKDVGKDEVERRMNEKEGWW